MIFSWSLSIAPNLGDIVRSMKALGMNDIVRVCLSEVYEGIRPGLDLNDEHRILPMFLFLDEIIIFNPPDSGIFG